MLFNSVIFITVFLPIALVGWYLLKKINNPLYAKVFLIGMSLWFYGYYNIRFLFVLLGSLLMNYLISFLLAHTTGNFKKRLVFVLGLLGNIGILFYFKYFNFFLDNCNYFLHTNIQIERIALPLGISFFTFQQISFVADRYKEKAPHYSMLDYACFITYFPQLIAGPIVLHSEFIPQLKNIKNKKLDAGLFFDGLSLFILGLAKKVLLADTLALLVNAVYNDIAIIPYYIDSVTGLITIVSYMLELYFDFSGYSDMARGIGKMFGFSLPENFNSPLKAVSVRDFWRRWHMTLSRFLTTYIYIPLGGNRKGLRRQCINIMIVFTVSGFWHGANWTFVVWGLLHGIAMLWETLFPKVRFKFEWMNRTVTFLYVTFTFSIFRSENLTQAFTLIKRIFTVPWSGYFNRFCTSLDIAETFALKRMLQMKAPEYVEVFFIVCVVILLVIAFKFLMGLKAEEWIEKKGLRTSGLLVLALLFVWVVISLSQVSTFLYFDF